MQEQEKKPASLLLKENIASFQATQTPDQRLKDYERLKKATETIRQSTTGKALLNWASQNNIHIAFDHQMDRDARGLYALDTVLISPDVEDQLLVSTIAHELRHAWQDKKGMIPNHYDMSPAEYMVKRRIVEADAFAHEMQICGELFEEGIPEPLNRLTNHPEIYDLFGKGIDAFLNTYHDDPETLYGLKAMRAAFAGWFDSEACNSYDSHSLKYFQRVLPTMQDELDHTHQEENKPKSASSFIKANIFEGQIDKHNGICYKDPLLFQDVFVTMDGRKYANPTDRSHLDHRAYNPDMGVSPNLSAQYIAVMDAYEDWKYAAPKDYQVTRHHVTTPKQ